MKLFKIPFFIISLLILISNIPAQYLSSSNLSGIGIPFFHAGIFRTFNESGIDSVRLVRIYFQIINDDLTFLKQDSFFVAEVEFDIFVNNEPGDFTFSRTIKKEIKLTEFDQTNSRKLVNSYSTEIELKPGKYDMIVTALDKTNNKQVNRKVKFELEDLKRNRFLISDILFFQEYEIDSTYRIISFNPNLTNNFGGQGKYFYFYFTSVVTDPSDTLEVEYIIRNLGGIVTQFNQYKIANNQNTNEHFIRINRQQFDQSRYELEVIGKYRNQVMKTQKTFSFFWTNNPDSPGDLSNALEQMRYIPEADSAGWAIKQPYTERLAYFQRFWKRMDPNPETEKNELMDEFFLRVNVTNQNFSTISQPGWQTDRGRIFIKFGDPDDIERHPFEINSDPYVIWRYYNYRKIFLFLDRSGFGDYYLHPDYLDEEYN
ncbi:MAG: GWxTD domain-containing protein [Calditrichia bacterium]|nr:GWxTD domain-containing protein [Calditrichia bacterium]